MYYRRALKLQAFLDLANEQGKDKYCSILEPFMSTYFNGLELLTV